uniref:GST N-terminal domain-containing protein n=1 Tax=Suricata suricatta TaxID=37032 RepID=A0A673V6N9_SURSU
MSMTLAYWDIHRLVHSIHLLLEYTDANYEEMKYLMRDAPTMTEASAMLSFTALLTSTTYGRKQKRRYVWRGHFEELSYRHVQSAGQCFLQS